MTTTAGASATLNSIDTVKAGAKTRTAEVYASIRTDILEGRVRPGERLSPAALSDRFGVSSSVVREALTRLAEQGLVMSQPQIGFQVTPISREDLLDLTAVRLDIETLALRRAVERGDMEWESGLVAAHYVLERTPQLLPDGTTNEVWLRVHADYHAMLLQACGSPRLLEIAQTLRDSADLYRRWSQRDTTAHRDVPAEHRAILDAVLAHDADAAVAALGTHIQHTTTSVLAISDADK